ncbi:MAG: alpha-ribazole phosphatase family protein [Pseudomonadota bacterium]
MGDLILVRHTTPEIAPGICYGQTDLDVTSKFLEEAETVAAALCTSSSVFAGVVTSPLRRCRKLAEYLSVRFSVPLREVAGLKEMDFGTWEGRPWGALPRVELDAWAADFLHARPHGGESVSMLRKRVTAALGQIRTELRSGALQQNNPTLIITHSGVIRAALSKGDTANDFSTNIDFGGFITLSSKQGTTP